MASLVPLRRSRIVSGAFVLVALVILVALGQWQLQRLKWKEDLLAHVAALKSAPARPIEALLASAEADADYARVALQCPNLMRTRRLRLFGVQDGQAGYHMMTACPLKGSGAGIVMVDLGFLPQPMQGEKPSPACAKCVIQTPLTGSVIGVLRHPDKATFVTPPNQPAQNLWYSRDLGAMAKALGQTRPAAAFVALEQAPGAAADPCGPKPSALPTNIPNRHLEYAITWFGLAAALAGVYVATLLRKRPD